MSGLSVTAKMKTFLVIDPDEKHLRTVNRYLMQDGVAKVHVASTLQFGLDILHAARPRIDCIICAEDLTPFTGIEFLKGLRSGRFGDAPEIRGAKFIMLTAHREATLVTAGMELDVDGFLVKPININSFRRHLHQALSRGPDLRAGDDYRKIDIGKAVRLPMRRGVIERKLGGSSRSA